MADPEQGSPPFRGSGLLQNRFLDRNPNSHSREQTDQAPHELQPPLITRAGLLPFRMRSSTRESVSQATGPSLAQNRVSIFFLPNCRIWGSDSCALQVYRKRCSWRDPLCVTLTGIQGVQGVFLRTSGHASGLHILNSWEQPGQVFPFSQVRCLVWTPPPQSALHLLHEPQEDQKMGTGQGLFSLQKRSSLLCPTHTLPPNRGAGLLHVLCRT